MMQSPGQRLRGWIRSFRGNWGFVNSDIFQGDIFVGLKSNTHLSALAEGDQIEFEVKTGKDGKNEAINVSVVTSAGQAYRGSIGAPRHTGFIRSFRDSWGFIRSDSFPGDIFVGLKSNTHLKALVTEDQVTFELRTDPETGKAEAISVELVNAPNYGSQVIFGPTVRAQVGHLVGHQMSGRIKNYRDSWGFVNCDSFIGDLFIHSRDNPGLGQANSGDPIQFEVAEDAKSPGNYSAVNAIPIKDNVQNLVGEMLRGTVKSFKSGWGFITSGRFHEDLFVGLKVNSQIGSNGLNLGEKVEFQVSRDEKGNGFQAVRVKRLDEKAQSMSGVGGMMNGRGGGGLGASAMVGRQCWGQVRSYRDAFGFVTSNQFAGDLFVGARSNPQLQAPLQEGDSIQFSVVQNGSKVEAVNVKVVGQVPAISNGAQGGQANMGGSMSIGGNTNNHSNPNRGGCGRTGPVVVDPRDRSRSPGGLINLPIGNTQQQRNMGMPIGKGAAGGGNRDPASMVGRSCSGIVKSYRGTWGFLNSSVFDGDVFVGGGSNKQLPRELQQGDKVHFVVSLGSSGKVEATSVQLM